MGSKAMIRWAMFAACLFWGTAAQAQSGGDFNLLVGAGADTRNSELGEYGTGFGLRLGYNWEKAPLYSGAIVSYYGGGQGELAERSVTTEYLQVGLEFGPVWQPLSHLILRPLAGVGFNVAEVATPGSSNEPTLRRLGAFIAPGLTVTFPWDMLRFGVEGRYSFMVGESSAQVASVFGTMGFVIGSSQQGKTPTGRIGRRRAARRQL